METAEKILTARVIPAAVTPFEHDGKIDLPGYARLLAWFRSCGCDGVLVGGTHGEGASLTAIERRDLARHAVHLSHGLQVVASILTNSLEEAKWLAKEAGKSGVSAVLVLPPAYFSEAPSAGILDWYFRLMDASPIPVLAYQFPARSAVDLTPEMIERLAQHERFWGLQDSSGDASRIRPYAQAAAGRHLYVGYEPHLIRALDHGWTGTISGAANVVGEWMVHIIKDYDLDRESANVKADIMRPIVEVLRKAPQPFVTKEILRRLGVLDQSDVRLPLLPCEDQVLIGEACAAARRLVSVLSNRLHR